MNQQTAPDSILLSLYRDLENQVRRYPVQTLRLPGGKRRPLGLLLIENGCTGRDVARALAELCLETRLFPTTQDGPAHPGGAGQEPLLAKDSCQVTVEERAQLFGFLHKDTCP